MAIDANTLLNEARCMGCNSEASQSTMMLLALLQRIAEAGAAAGGSPGGPLNAVQFNSPLGTFGGSADLTFDDATNLLTMAGALNTTAVLLGNGAAGTPSLAFASDTTTGIYRVGASRIGFATGGTLVGEFNNLTFELKANVQLNWNADLKLERDAANVLGQRNGATAQTLRVYRTFTNAANYERLALQTAAGQMIVASESAGTGAANLDLTLVSKGTGQVAVPGGAVLLKTSAALTDTAAAALATITNSPVAGNPTKWFQINDNGTLRSIPAW